MISEPKPRIEEYVYHPAPYIGPKYERESETTLRFFSIFSIILALVSLASVAVAIVLSQG